MIRLINVPGQTKGSIIYYDDKSKLMFTGDDVNPCLWLWLGGCTDVEKWLESARKIAEISKGYLLYGGHEAGLITSKSLLELVARGEVKSCLVVQRVKK